MLKKNEAEIIRLYTEGTDWLAKNDRGNVILRRGDGSTLVFESVEAYNEGKPERLEAWPSWVSGDAVLQSTESGGWFPRSEENDVVALVASCMRLWDWQPRCAIL